MKEPTLEKQTAKTTVLAAAGRAFGFLVPFVIAAWFETGLQTDAFFLSYGMILFLMSSIGSVFEMVVVPFMVEFKTRKEDPGVFLGKILLRVWLFLAAFIFFLILTLKPLLSGLTPFSFEMKDFLFILILQMIPTLFLSMATDLMNGALNAYKKFQTAALSPAYRSFLILAAAFFLRKTVGIYSLAWGYVIGEMLRFLVSYWNFRKVVGQIHFQGHTAKGIDLFFKSAVLQISGLLFINGVSLVDQTMASWLGAGAISLYNYAEKLRNAPFLLFATGAGPVALAHWAEGFSAAGNFISWKTIKQDFRKFFLFALGLSLLLIVFRLPLVSLILRHGKFPADQVRPVAQLFAILVAGVPFQVINLLAVRLLVIFKKNKQYLFLGASLLILDIPFNYLLMWKIGINGIALSTTLLEAIVAMIFWQKLPRWISAYKKIADGQSNG